MDTAIFISLLTIFSFSIFYSPPIEDCSQQDAFDYFDLKVKSLKEYNDLKDEEFSEKIDTYKSLLRTGKAEDYMEGISVSTELTGISSSFYKETVERKNKIIITTYAIIESMETSSDPTENCIKLDKIKDNLSLVELILQSEWNKVLASIDAKIKNRVAFNEHEESIVRDFSSRRPKQLAGMWLDITNKEQNLILSENGEAHDQNYHTKLISNPRYWFIRDDRICMDLFDDTVSLLCFPYELKHDTLHYQLLGEWNYFVKKGKSTSK